MLHRSLTAVAVALTLMLPRVAPSQTESLGTELLVPPSQIQAASIAVAPLQPTAGSARMEGNPFQRVIERNLEISGWLMPNREHQLIATQDASDRRTGQINFAEWGRLGVDYFVSGSYTLRGDIVDFEVTVYDVLARARAASVTDRNDDPRLPPVRDPVDAAHVIADAIVQNLTGEQGIAQSRILYILQTAEGRELAVMDCDGGRSRLLTRDGATLMAACWGANNQEIYFTSTVQYNPDLLGMFLDGSQRWAISEHPGLNLAPAWSPDGQRIALTLSRDGNSEIYTMGRDGSRPLRLTTNRAIDSSPCWTPDGRALVFTSDRDGNRPQIWAMDQDGRRQRRLTVRRGSNYNDGANVSPDGRRIVFTSKVDGQFDIFAMDIDGRADSWVRLTDSPADDEDPCWTLDGQHVVFSSTRSGQRQIHIMNADGSNVHQLTTRGVNLSPMAEPLLN